MLSLPSHSSPKHLLFVSIPLKTLSLNLSKTKMFNVGLYNEAYLNAPPRPLGSKLYSGAKTAKAPNQLCILSMVGE